MATYFALLVDLGIYNPTDLCNYLRRRNLGLFFFLDSMIIPGLEKVFTIFQVLMIFPEAGKPEYSIGSESP